LHLMKNNFFFSFNSAKSCYSLLSTLLINEKKDESFTK